MITKQEMWKFSMVFYGVLGLESVSLEENERRYYNNPPIE